MVAPVRTRVVVGMSGGVDSSATAALLREAAIELLEQEMFSAMKKDDQARLRDLVLTFLEGRSREDPLTPDELVRLGDQLADAFPDRRADVTTFALRLNRVLELYTPTRK